MKDSNESMYSIMSLTFHFILILCLCFHLIIALGSVDNTFITIPHNPVAAHLCTFLKECGSFAHTIFPGKRIHLRTQFPQVNVTFAHTRFS